jgi:dUTP pyrophosphatase
MNIKIKEIREGYTPVYKHPIDACCDCFANLKEPLCIKTGETVKIPLGFAVEIPIGYEGITKGRSGLNSKGLILQIGCIDPGYTGEVCAIVTNLTGQECIVEDGDRICQFKIQESKKIQFEKVEKLADSERSDKGFGSTGVKS